MTNNIINAVITQPQTLLQFSQQWIDSIEIKETYLANIIVRLIPATCPFARKIYWRQKRVVLSIPPLCKLNPLYEQLMFLRFRALSFLAEAS